ncbi:MAG: hypothetical protein BRD23_03635 [Halobacteriales archaeon SW_9_67_25]|jgi:hypothetical protein|nr:MAG: hypothetical protein BRD23_03635 [Halobacteriales archaeon SW_9_67_25]
MSREELASARDRLASATEEASEDAGTTLSDLAGQLDRLAGADRGPDHGRLARIEAKLDDVQTDESDDVAAAIDAALDDIHAYRETIEGV